MKPDKNSMDYQLNLLALEEMENLVPMTLHERTCIRKWVKSGHEIESQSMALSGCRWNAFKLPSGLSPEIWISQWTLELLERSGRTVSLG